MGSRCTWGREGPRSPGLLPSPAPAKPVGTGIHSGHFTAPAVPCLFGKWHPCICRSSSEHQTPDTSGRVSKVKSEKEVGVLRDTMGVEDKNVISHPQAWKTVIQTGPAATESL